MNMFFDSRAGYVKNLTRKIDTKDYGVGLEQQAVRIDP